ncbi:hypothetical protein [uncultured Shewanella sp.]|uniref:hypothetical protein n=1 Tax=uncultured Shewanella sp. TaxID=173975 RepID=UPI002608CCA3|nr:hypothetical protein [uncultured Shewanella sp.]
MNKIIVYLALAIIIVCVLSLIFSPQHSTQTSSISPCHFPNYAPSPKGTITDFNQYSWRQFIALNWPSQTQHKGKPDCSLSLNDKQQSVWQSFKNINELFNNAQKFPPLWNKKQQQAPLSQLTKVTSQATNLSTLQQIGGWLIDQQGNPTYYEILINQTSFDYIVKNKLYDYSQLKNKQMLRFPHSSTHIKASWRLLTPMKDDLSRYITKQAKVQVFDSFGQATNEIKHATLGLVGLHIATKAAGYPQWIWSTFEHNDNVPIQIMENNTIVNQPKSDIDYHYYNANSPSSDVNQSPCLWIEKPSFDPLTLPLTSMNVPVICQAKKNINFNTPTPLDRVIPINEMTKEVNQYQQKNIPVKQTALANYQLIATQYPTEPNNASDPLGKPTPTLVANTTMESYIQDTSSCIDCHSQATLPSTQVHSDHSYLFLSLPSSPTPHQ